MRALVREIPDSFVDGLCMTASPEGIDVPLARTQHAAYRSALAAGGAAEILVLAADEACPDSVFVEDTAVIVGDRALITRPGAPSRRAETGPIAAELARHVTIVHIDDDTATIDGGDVLAIAGRIFVGQSKRTNAAGIAALARAFPDATVVPVELVRHVLHLKCVVSRLDAETIVLADDTLPAEVFAGLRIVAVPYREQYAANVVALPNHVLVADGYPRTRDALEVAGYRTCVVPVSEVKKADGSLTCQSLLW